MGRYRVAAAMIAVALVAVSAVSVEALRPTRPAAVIMIDECDPVVGDSIEVSWRRWQASSVTVEYLRRPRRDGNPWVSGRVRSRIVEVQPSATAGSVVVPTPKRALKGRWYVHKVQLFRRTDAVDRSRFVEKVFDCGVTPPTTTVPTTIPVPTTPPPSPACAPSAIQNVPSPLDSRVSPDGQHLFVLSKQSSGGNGGLVILDTATEKVLADVRVTGEARGLAMNSDHSNAYLVAGQSLYIIDIGFALDNDAGTDPIVKSLSFDGTAQAVVVRPDDLVVYVALATDEVKVVETTGNTVVSTITGGKDPDEQDVGIQAPIALEIDDRGLLYVANYTADTVAVFFTSDGSPAREISVGDKPQAMEYTRNKLYVVNEGGSVSIGDGVTVVKTLTGFAAPMEATPAGERLYVSNLDSGKVAVIDMVDDVVLETEALSPVDGSPVGVAVSPNGRRLYVMHTSSDRVGVLCLPVVYTFAFTHWGSPDGRKGLVVADVVDSASKTAELSTSGSITLDADEVLDGPVKVYVPKFLDPGLSEYGAYSGSSTCEFTGTQENVAGQSGLFEVWDCLMGASDTVDFVQGYG